MKKITVFAAACMALAACNKQIDTTTEIGKGAAFEQGQTVTLSVNTTDQSKVAGSLDAATGTVNFAWETGDKIKVIVGSESAEFTLSSGAGTASATFTGTMPAAGNTFDVQYPVSTPDLTSQTYVANGLPKDKMKMAATGCSLGAPFTLNPQSAALRLNLYGLNREVNNIVVTNTTADPNVSYTLNCSAAVRVGNSAAAATPFCIVVPEGSWSFKVDITSVVATKDLEDIPVYNEGQGFFSGDGIIIPNNSFSTSSALSFTAGVVQNMAAKPITIIWAPVNCGYEAANGEYKGYTYGRMYQWGRKYGHGYKDLNYEDDDYPRTSNIKVQTIVNISKTEELLTNHPDGADYNGNFYSVDINSKNWYGGLNADKLWNANEGTSNPVSKSAYDPCPEGWRVPTKVELEILKGTKTALGTIETGTHGTSEVYGSKFDGGDGNSANYVFLPIAGYITLGGTSSKRGNDWGSIYYWSSTVDNSGKSYMLLKGMKGGLMISTDGRAFGCSVRCVKE